MKTFELRDIQLKMNKTNDQMAEVIGVSSSNFRNMKYGIKPIPKYIEKSLYAHLQLWVIDQKIGTKLHVGG